MTPAPTPTHNLPPVAFKFLGDTLGSQQIQVLPLAGDASTRRYSRVIHADLSYVLMQWEPFVDDGNYPFLNVLEHFRKHGVRVPKVIAKAPTLGLVLLEDLGDLTLERKFWENQNQQLAMPYYKQAIDELIKMHYLASTDMAAPCVAFKVAFNTEKLLWEMNYGLEHLIEKFCHIELTPASRKEMLNIFTDICSRLDREPKYICHRDYHSRNVMLTRGQARVIDFQDARMGAIQYDLVSLVHDSYVDLNDASRQEILNYYLEQARPYLKTARTGSQSHADIDAGHFQEVFALQMIQRCFKACGSFASFYNTREDLRYLKYLQPTVRKVADVLAEHPQYALFSNLIRDNGLLEMDYLNPTEMHR